MKINSNKRGQVTIFIIIAIVIVVLGVLIFLLYPRITSSSSFEVENPERFLQDCVEDELKDLIKDLSMQGISLAPKHYVPYEYEDKIYSVQYLCYTSTFGQPCIRSPVFLIVEFQNQISENIKVTVDNCFEALETSYVKKSYTISDKKKGIIKTEIFPTRTLLEMNNYEITVTKGSSQKYKSFNIVLNNNLYELLNTASSILEDEVNFGSAKRIQYMFDNLNLRITGEEKSDSTNIYVLENKKTKEKLIFASRSLILPPETN